MHWSFEIINFEQWSLFWRCVTILTDPKSGSFHLRPFMHSIKSFSELSLDSLVNLKSWEVGWNLLANLKQFFIRDNKMDVNLEDLAIILQRYNCTTYIIALRIWTRPLADLAFISKQCILTRRKVRTWLTDTTATASLEGSNLHYII